MNASDLEIGKNEIGTYLQCIENGNYMHYVRVHSFTNKQIAIAYFCVKLRASKFTLVI